MAEGDVTETHAALTDRYETAEFTPYVAALGKFALSWNELQDNLCSLFSIVSLNRAPQVGDVVSYFSAHVWHSIRSDRSQREMLDAAIKHSALASANLTEHGKWLIDRVTSLENRRNDILHSPLISWRMGTSRTVIVPNTFMRNPRAIGLAENIDVLKEIKSAANHALELSRYAERIAACLLNPGQPWPEKPARQGQNKKPKAKVPRSQHK